MTDFFISYTGADKKWAEWIGWVLETPCGRNFDLDPAYEQLVGEEWQKPFQCCQRGYEL